MRDSLQYTLVSLAISRRNSHCTSKLLISTRAKKEGFFFFFFVKKMQRVYFFSFTCVARHKRKIIDTFFARISKFLPAHLCAIVRFESRVYTLSTKKLTYVGRILDRPWHPVVATFYTSSHHAESIEFWSKEWSLTLPVSFGMARLSWLKGGKVLAINFRGVSVYTCSLSSSPRVATSALLPLPSPYFDGFIRRYQNWRQSSINEHTRSSQMTNNESCNST